MRLFTRLMSALLRAILSLRYRVVVEGLDEIKKNLKKGQGILFLPNHPAEIDPVILFSNLHDNFSPCPLVVEHFYYLPGVSFFMKLTGAIPIPDFDVTVNQWKLKKVDKVINEVMEKIRMGKNFLIYPSGQLKREAHEGVGGSSVAHRVIRECPETQIVLVRTTGLWGSRFSRAITGDLPDFWAMLRFGIKAILKNGIFFSPRRKVTISCSLAPDDFPRKGSRIAFNQYLEKWYNQYQDKKGNIVTSEPLSFVSSSCFKEVFPAITRVERKQKEKQHLGLEDKRKDEIFHKLEEVSGQRREKFHEDSDLAIDLGLDSLDVAGIGAFLTEMYDVPPAPPQEMKTVYDLFEIAAGKRKSSGFVAKLETPIQGWPEEEDRPEIKMADGETLPEVFLNSCERMGHAIACADMVSGILSYKKLKLGVIILAKKIRDLPGDEIGILLPSSVAAYLVVMATLLAKKTPVVLNWTAGVRTLNFSAEYLGIQTVISSRKFLDRMSAIELGILEDRMILMEDLRKTISFADKLLGKKESFKGTKALLKRFGIDGMKKEDTAVILFTSGTEAYPKAVPLSHNNLISNQRAALSCIDTTPDDVLYGVLPPFHSFGLSVTGILPLLHGLKVFYAPDPTDAASMARDIEKMKITLLCYAPSFYKNLFKVAEKKQLGSVRLFLSGAEKASDDLFDYVEDLGHECDMIEGYGITECSPVVTLCRQHQPRIGVGSPLPEVELCIIHPETEKLLGKNELGEVCIKGPGVFKGYLGKNAPNPFIEINGERWYRSSDLGMLDDQNNLIFSGRLKRFVKIGGEMVSLIALEEELLSASRNLGWNDEEEDKAILAISVKDRESERPHFILYTTFKLSRELANKALKDAGFARIVKISEVKQIKEIPITGTGKVHYRRLDEWS